MFKIQDNVLKSNPPQLEQMLNSRTGGKTKQQVQQEYDEQLTAYNVSREIYSNMVSLAKFYQQSRLNQISPCFLFARSSVVQKFNGLVFFDYLLLEGDARKPSSLNISLYNSMSQKRTSFDIGFVRAGHNEMRQAPPLNTRRAQQLVTELNKPATEACVTYAKTGGDVETMCKEWGIFRTKKGNYMSNEFKTGASFKEPIKTRYDSSTGW